MILTCPECATSYFVEDSAVGDGRTVRCASCGATWRAAPLLPLELTVDPEAGALARVPEPASEPTDEALFDRPVSELPAPALPKAFRARAQNERRVREAAVQGAMWAGMGVAVALLVGLAVVFRLDVVRAWPKAASAYAAIGLPVNTVGLGIEGVHAQMALKEGHPALLVSGVLRNLRARDVTAPPLQIAVLDKHGKRLMTRTAAVPDPSVPAGQTRSFQVAVLDPPPAASGLDVTFATAAAAPTAAARTLRPAAPPARAMLVGPLPPAPEAPAPQTAAPAGAPGPVEDARPLPSSSPYALPSTVARADP